MKKCPKCSSGLPDQVRFCPQCGAKQPPLPAGPRPDADTTPSSSIHRSEWLAYVGEAKAPYYFPHFARFANRSRGRTILSWNWAAFFTVFWWFLYRKMYLWAALSLPAGLFFSLPSMIACGLCGNYLYFVEAEKKIIAIKKAHPGQSPVAELAEAGGVHEWIFWAASIFFFLLALFWKVPSFVAYTLGL